MLLLTLLVTDVTNHIRNTSDNYVRQLRLNRAHGWMKLTFGAIVPSMTDRDFTEAFRVSRNVFNVLLDKRRES